MNRREFAVSLGSTGLVGLVAPGVAQAQGGPVEGRDYIKLQNPQAVPPGKVEVVEFFGYWCPHCNAFEPALEAWVHKLPADQVVFHRVPVAFRPSQESLQRLYYALEALGLVESLHGKVFAAVHVERRAMASDADIAAWARAVGADAAKIGDMMKSFSVAGKLRQARAMLEGYAIDGVPTLGVAGRWRTAPSIAGSEQRALAVTDALIGLARRG